MTRKATLSGASRVIDILRQNAQPVPKPTDKFKQYAQKLYEYQLEKERLEIELKDVKDKIEGLAKVDLPNAMLAMGVLSPDNKGEVTLENGLKAFCNTQVFVSCPVHRSAELQAWLKTVGLEGLIKSTVHPSSLTANIERLIDEGKEELIPEFVTIHKQTVVKVKSNAPAKPRAKKA